MEKNAYIDSSITGNAATATKFASSQPVALTGDVTGSASSTAGWSVATTLSNSGVTAGSYGPSANASPAHSGTFSVPYITVDAKGRVTSASTKTITLPSDNNTDTKVTNTLATTTKFYLTGTSSSSTNTGTQYFDTGIYTTTTAGELVVGSLQTTNSYDGTTSYTSTPLGLSYFQTADTDNGSASLYSSTLTVNQSANRQFQICADNGGSILAFRSAHVNNTGGTGTGWSAWKKIYHEGNKPTPAAIGAAASSHTHNYAGSSSAGGVADSATKLSTARTISLGGLLSGSASFDGSGNVSISATAATPPKSGDWFSGGIPTVSTGGVMEVGKYIDFHNSDTSTNDYDVRLQSNTAGPIVVNLPTSAGTLALTSHTHSYLPLSGGTLTGALSISKSGDGATLLNFDTERGWQFQQIGTGSSTSLGLVASTNGKSFKIMDASKAKMVEIYTDTSGATITADGNITTKGDLTANGNRLWFTNIRVQDMNSSLCAVKYDGTAFAPVTASYINLGEYSGATYKLTIAASAPSSPTTGDIWIDI